MDVQGAVIAPYGIDGSSFEAQRLHRLPHHAEGNGVGKVQVAVQIRVGQIDRDLSHSRNVSDMVFLVEFHMSSHGLFDAAAVGQAGGPLVVEFVVRGEVEAGGNAGTGEHLVLVPDRDNVSVFFMSMVAYMNSRPTARERLSLILKARLGFSETVLRLTYSRLLCPGQLLG